MRDKEREKRLRRRYSSGFFFFRLFVCAMADGEKRRKRNRNLARKPPFIPFLTLLRLGACRSLSRGPISGEGRAKKRAEGCEKEGADERKEEEERRQRATKLSSVIIKENSRSPLRSSRCRTPCRCRPRNAAAGTTCRPRSPR